MTALRSVGILLGREKFKRLGDEGETGAWSATGTGNSFVADDSLAVLNRDGSGGGG